MSEAARILILEDELSIARLIGETLTEYGFVCEQYGTGKAFLDHARRHGADLCIVDLSLPDMDGMEVVRCLRAEGIASAVLILSGRQELSDRVLGLELGADDYVMKPFEPRELVARVRSVLRRYVHSARAEADSVPATASFAGWQFDYGQHQLKAPDGRCVELSASEAALLHVFLQRPNRILSREQLLGEREVEPFDRSIDVRISRLRRKLDDDPHEPRLIKTIYGAGYLFTEKVQWH